ncbi:MAG: ferredoxin [Candidatus Marinimicrobia bacterium]|nr:ferredoxin [Candidatus Neomarinimicrobiota bacterium]MCF7828498.1 ferredoxin [Candidatus Neomarinimicrobiota bacterium]MCF7881988.1 ferredoxin [Candidatus Neomarinimicrobiota bacterium]
MADKSKRLFLNFPGEFFVDSTCINCDACRQIAPETFAEAEDYAYVKAQPSTDEEERRALRALISCPTGSIGTVQPNNAAEVISDFPLRLDEGVHYCGFNSRESAGGNSYFIEHAGGNWLVDAPRFHRHLVGEFAKRGGVDFIFLSSWDFSETAAQYAREFDAQRIAYAGDDPDVPDAEVIIRGKEPVEFLPDFRIIPSSGNRQMLLLENRYLFTGDLFWWVPYREKLKVPEHILQSGDEQLLTSLGQLASLAFEYVLPAHGHRVKRSAEEMEDRLQSLIHRIS